MLTFRKTALDVISTRDLCKSYGTHQVLYDVNLSLGKGKLLGFLGPNGAGKSTTIRILMGLLQASSGDAELFGTDCWKNGPTLRKDIGYLPGEPRFYSRMTGRATLDMFANIRGVDCKSEVKRLSTEFDLDIDRIVRKYSSGMKQKLGLMQAFMHRPQLLILDEPTTALDPLVKQTVHHEIRRTVADGRTVLFSSHSLSEVASLCEEVAILRDGRLIEHERVDVLRGRAIRKVEVEFRGTPPAQLPEHFQVSSSDNNWCRGRWLGEVEELNRWLTSQAISDLVIEPPDLEDLFLAYYSKQEETP